jgi:hypothetical protein
MSLKTWLCLQTATGKEYKLAEQLQALGVESYAPRYRKTYARPSTKYNPIKRAYEQVYTDCRSPFAFFPAYLFASPEYYERRLSIKLLPVSLKSRVIGTIEDYFIESLKEREQDGFIVTVKDKLDFQRGDAIIINSQGFLNVEAIFLEHSPANDRIKVLMQAMGGQREIEFRSASVRITPAYA